MPPGPPPVPFVVVVPWAWQVEVILMRVETLRGRFGCDERHEKIERRRVHFLQARELEGRYELRLDFHRPAALVVLQHRRFVRRSGGGLRAGAAFWTMRRLLDRDIERPGDGARLFASARGDRFQP